MSSKLAFFDFDGTLVPGNVVDQYLWLVRRAWSLPRFIRLALIAKKLKRTDAVSREQFNHLFYGEYRGFSQAWLERESLNLYTRHLRPHLFAGVPGLLQRNRDEGYVNVLVSGSLEFAMKPVGEDLKFAHVLANRIEFVDGRASGRLLEPVLAGGKKVTAMLELCRRYNVEPKECRAYSDDVSDLPMLEAVGQPFATNPKPDLRRIAAERNWPVKDLR